jgi:hypothetical protein
MWHSFGFLGKVMRKGRGSSVIIDCSDAQAFKCAIIGEHELQGVNNTGLTFAIRREDRKAPLLLEIEFLGLEKSAKSL